jgi:hypothetical protein
MSFEELEELETKKQGKDQNKKEERENCQAVGTIEFIRKVITKA